MCTGSWLNSASVWTVSLEGTRKAEITGAQPLSRGNSPTGLQMLEVGLGGGGRNWTTWRLLSGGHREVQSLLSLHPSIRAATDPCGIGECALLAAATAFPGILFLVCLSFNGSPGTFSQDVEGRDGGGHVRNWQVLRSQLHWPKSNVQPNNIHVWELTLVQVRTSQLLSPRLGTMMTVLLCWALLRLLLLS